MRIAHLFFSGAGLDALARQTGFIERSPRKITPAALLGAICRLCTGTSPSCNDLAAHIARDTLREPSRQAVHLRLKAAFEQFVEKLLARIIARRCAPRGHDGGICGVFREYRRVIVQDSTVIQLPDHLYAHFSGVRNAHRSSCGARIQAVYDLISGCLLHFSIDAYSRNDRAAAPALQLREGDLVLRDRGYLTIDELRRHRQAAADCIYRHQSGWLYYDARTLEPLDLPALLRARGCLDREVLLSDRTRVRLVAAPVDEQTANLRRMRAKQQTKGRNPSKAVLFLMGWTIFITTVPAERADFAALLGLYGLRWRIEIIFKAWKSQARFDHLHRLSRRQVLILLKVRLLLLAACANLLHAELASRLWRGFGRRLSLLKFMRHLCGGVDRIFEALECLRPQAPGHETFLRYLARYCCYEKRRKRRNYEEIWDDLALT